jgi:hypothetical protein
VFIVCCRVVTAMVTTVHARITDAVTKSKVATAASKVSFSFLESYYAIKDLI